MSITPPRWPVYIKGTTLVKFTQATLKSLEKGEIGDTYSSLRHFHASEIICLTCRLAQSDELHFCSFMNIST